jgi:transposase InsO family protein
MAPTTRSGQSSGPSSGGNPDSNDQGTNPPDAMAPSNNPSGPDCPETTRGPGNVLMPERFMTDPSWLKDLTLDISKSNWTQWCRQLRISANEQGFSRYLDGTLKCPNVNVHPTAHWIWDNNNRSLRAFILRHISPDDYELVEPIESNGTHAMFQKLRKRHEQLGLYSQVLLIKKAMEMRFDATKNLDDTIIAICSLHTRIMNMGNMDSDSLLIVFLVSALGDDFPHLQSNIQSMSTAPGFSSLSVTHHIQDENKLLRNQEAQGLPVTPVTALAAVGQDRSGRPPCSNCKRTNHHTNYCVMRGGKMAGRTIDEARATQHAASSRSGQPPKSASAHAAASMPPPPVAETGHSVNSSTQPSPVPTPSISPAPQTISVNGVTYVLPRPATPSVAMAAVSTPEWQPLPPSVPHGAESWEYHAYLASGVDPQVSIDWNSYSRPVDPSRLVASPSAFTASHPVAERMADCQFAFDTAATCHISPECSDFKTLRPIPQHPVKGLGGACVYTIGIGNIELRIAAGHTLTLQDVLYVPASSIRLLSVLTLNRSGRFVSHFDSDSCWVTNKAGATVARGYVSNAKNLYILSCPSLRVTHTRPQDSAYYSISPTPDVETWHRRLGHCSTRTVIDMARTRAVAGMKIDLSNAPPKCNHCILGKQTRTPVPKSRVNEKATCPLQKVFVDLCGPMHVTSRSGRLYSMNVIDDFSSYVWSLPLRSKSDAAPVLQTWAKAIEAISGHKLVTLVTDNGELVSKSMTDWCSIHGITHLLTAPHTSAQNGHAERLHHTILDKARTMRIACNAPSNLWDEFCATSAYLTNLTASSSTNGKTPSELWLGRIPDISHLCEIGSQAFALNLGPNPKLAR